MKEFKTLSFVNKFADIDNIDERYAQYLYNNLEKRYLDWKIFTGGDATHKNFDNFLSQVPVKILEMITNYIILPQREIIVNYSEELRKEVEQELKMKPKL